MTFEISNAFQDIPILFIHDISSQLLILVYYFSFFFQGMMGNSGMPMSPNTLSPGGKAAFFRGMCSTLIS